MGSSNPPQGGGGGGLTEVTHADWTDALKDKTLVAVYKARGTTASVSSVELDAGISVSAGVAATDDTYLVVVGCKNSGNPSGASTVRIRFLTTGGNVEPNLNGTAVSLPSFGGLFSFTHAPVADSLTGIVNGSREGTEINSGGIKAMSLDPMASAHTLSVRGNSGDAGVTMSWNVVMYRLGGTA